MLKLLIFAPCETALMSDERIASLIKMIEGVKVDVTERLPEDAAIPMKWNVLALWRRLQDYDQDIQFEQRIDVITPNGETIVNRETSFTVSNAHRNYRNILNLHSFRLQHGSLLLRIYLKNQDIGEWEEKGEFPIDDQRR